MNAFLFERQEGDSKSERRHTYLSQSAIVVDEPDEPA